MFWSHFPCFQSSPKMRMNSDAEMNYKANLLNISYSLYWMWQVKMNQNNVKQPFFLTSTATTHTPKWHFILEPGNGDPQVTDLFIWLAPSSVPLHMWAQPLQGKSSAQCSLLLQLEPGGSQPAFLTGEGGTKWDGKTSTSSPGSSNPRTRVKQQITWCWKSSKDRDKEIQWLYHCVKEQELNSDFFKS